MWGRWYQLHICYRKGSIYGATYILKLKAMVELIRNDPVIGFYQYISERMFLAGKTTVECKHSTWNQILCVLPDVWQLNTSFWSMFAVFLMRGTGFICTSTERDRCPRNGTFKNLMIITQKQMVHFILLYVFIGETNVANILPYEVPVTLQTTCIDT